MALVMPFGVYVWLFLVISILSVSFVIIAMDRAFFMAFPVFQRTGYIFEGKFTKLSVDE